MQKAVIIKQPGQLCCRMTPIHLLEASGAPAFTLQQGGWIAQRAAGCGLHNSVKLRVGLNVLRHPGGVEVDLTVTERFS